MRRSRPQSRNYWMPCTASSRGNVMALAAANRPGRKAPRAKLYRIDELPPRLQREALRRDLREDFSIFVRAVFRHLHPGETYLHNWHVDLLCDILAGARRGRRLRKIINLPPRSLKSIIVSVALPAWLMGHDPTRKIIVVSYSDDLARKLSRAFERSSDPIGTGSAFPTWCSVPRTPKSRSRRRRTVIVTRPR